jgi:hypothetical protein
MVGSSHFVKPCPICGRTLQIQVRYIGREVSCGHCHGRFLAYHGEMARDASATFGKATDALQRADELLNSLDDVA